MVLATLLSELVIVVVVRYAIRLLTIVLLTIVMQLAVPEKFANVVELFVYGIIAAVGCVLAVVGWLHATIVALVWVIAPTTTAVLDFVVPAAIAVLGWAVIVAEVVVPATITVVIWVIPRTIVAVGWIIAMIIAVVGWMFTVEEWVHSAAIATEGWVIATIIAAFGWLVAVVELTVLATITAVGSVVDGTIVGVGWITAATIAVVEWVVAVVGWINASVMANWRSHLSLAVCAAVMALIEFCFAGVTVTITIPSLFNHRRQSIPPAQDTVVTGSRPTSPACAGQSLSPNDHISGSLYSPPPRRSLNQLADEASILLELFSKGSHPNDNITDEYHGIITNATAAILTINARLRQANQRARPREVPNPDPDCIICYAETANTLFMPCNHLVVCTVRMSRGSWSLLRGR